MQIDRLKRERYLFTIGCISLCGAILAVTFFPFIINNYLSNIFVSIKMYTNYAMLFYGLTIGCFIFSPRYTNLQIKWIVITFAYYILFEILVKVIL